MLLNDSEVGSNNGSFVDGNVVFEILENQWSTETKESQNCRVYDEPPRKKKPFTLDFIPSSFEKTTIKSGQPSLYNNIILRVSSKLGITTPYAYQIEHMDLRTLTMKSSIYFKELSTESLFAFLY